MKKLTAGIFTVLMGLVSVNAADAAVASKGYVDQFVGENGSITTKVTTLETKVGDANSGLVKDVAALQTQLANGELKINDNAILTNMIKDGQVTEAKLSTELAGKINDKANTSDVNAELAKKENVDNKASAITDGMQKNVMYPTVSLTEELIATSNQDMSDLIGDVADGKTVVEMISDGDAATLASAKEDATTKADKALADAKTYADQAEADAIATAAADATSKANAAQAAAATDATTKADKALADAKIYADQAEADAIATAAADATSKANAAQAAAATDATTKADKALADAKTYADQAEADAIVAANGYTDASIQKLNLNELSRVPAECGVTGKYCVLTSDGSNFLWEVIERGADESQPAGQPIPSVQQ